MTPKNPTARLVWFLAWFLAGMIRVGQSQEADPAAKKLPIPLELQPYQVHILLADSRARPLPHDDWAATLAACTERTWGGFWDLTVQTIEPPPWFDSAGFADYRFEISPSEQPLDVVYLVWVAQRADGLELLLRSRELRWDHTSPILRETVLDERELPMRILLLTRKLFRPLATWEKRDDQSVWVTIKGAALAEADPDHPLVEVGELLTPWLISLRRDGSLNRQQALPWTYFRLESLEKGRGWASVVSGLQAPLAIKSRGRMEFVAVAARPQWPETRFECWAQTQPPRPMAAHRVAVRADEHAIRPQDHAASSTASEIWITDRSGGLTFSVQDQPRLLWLTVYSGTLKLAYVPLAVGTAPLIRINLPDDSVRLEAEGQLQLIQSELIDEVARRSAEIAVVKAAAKKQDWETVKKYLERLRKQSIPQPFLERVSAVRVAAVNAAQKNKDRVTEQRVIRMCEETNNLIRRYLNEDRIRLLEEELAELRSDNDASSAPTSAAAPRQSTPKLPFKTAAPATKSTNTSKPASSGGGF